MIRQAALVLALLVPGLLQADTFPTQERGFQAEKAFHLGDFDTVNLFNGNLILTIPIGGTYPVGGGLSYGLTLAYNSNAWDFQEDGFNVYRQALPNRRSNAGLGWRLSLGELLEPADPANDTGGWLYVGADGAEHFFYDSLHEGESVITGVKYTRDGSYLRFRYVASDKRAVDLPDGLTRIFTRNAQFDWRLTRIEDRFDNWVSVVYVNDQTGKAVSWTIQDQHGRTQTVNLVSASWFGRVIGSVVLSAFNGTTATYSFGYTPATIPRACPDNDPQTGDVTVPLLTSVTLPDGSSWSMPTTDYHLNGSAGCRLPGVLKAVTTPLLGRVEWGYGGYGFPTEADEKPWRNLSHGVYSRTLKNHSGVTVGTWTYAPSLNPIPGPNQPGREAVRAVITPLGDKTESFFSVALDAAYTGWSQFDYGLPFTRNLTDGGTPARYLSTRVHDCDPGAVNCALKRSTYVAYERDEGLFNADFQTNLNRNRRVSATRTTYEDDGGRWESAAYSNFDGLGHYRQTDLSGNFDAGNSAKLFTNYNSSRGTYPGSFFLPSSGEPWVLGTYNEQSRTEGAETARTEHCFDANGFRIRTRTLFAGVDQQPQDVVAVFAHTNGNLTQEQYYGGDVQALLEGELCTLDLPASSQYQIDHTWQYGARKTSQHSGAAFKSLDADIDLNTGLVKASRDGGGIQTGYEHDFFGRLAWVKPAAGHDGWTQYVYSRSLGANSPAQVQVLRQPNGGGTALAESIVKYDSFGRVWQEHTKMPDGSYSIRQTQYNPLHWKVSVSELGTPAKKTEYLEYDPFGRPGKIRPADGIDHEVSLYYSGVRQVSRNSQVGNVLVNGTVDEVVASTVEIYDRQGRLYQVKEPAEADGTNTNTYYSYDVGNRLKRVRQVTSKGTQNRWFLYDNRGFLTSEQHPEKGSAGNGTVTYLDYDARGHARRKVDGSNDLTFAYDSAEMLTDVSETGGRPLKSFTYGADGRLATATRYNYVSTPFNATVQVTETYTYRGRQGRVSRRSTQMTYNGVVKESFAQTWTWNALGDPSTIGYPECTFAGCTAASRSANPAYTNGFLTSVPGWANSITYHPNGTINQVTHSNGVVDTQGVDPNGMARPSSLSASKNGVTLWSSGAYVYDTSGNVVKTGNGYFLYDRVSRLIEGRIYDGPTGGGTQKWQSYTYDPFGNILSIGGTSGRSTPTSSATNRLNGTGTAYDATGNLTNWNGNTYEYDRFNQMTRMLSGAEDWRYMYGPSDERFWSYRVGGGGSLWALRDLDGRVLREYEAHANWSTFKDYVYRGTQLLAAEHPSTGARHFHLDHLGTPRLITDAAGAQRAYHVYYPFGEEATAFNQDNEQMKFTGHERDLASLAGAGDDLDYMHGRFFLSWASRFSSFDPGKPKVQRPQLWNRFSYVGNNPLAYVDPDGKERAAILLDHDNQALLAGELTPDEYVERLTVRGYGALGGFSLVAGGISGSAAFNSLAVSHPEAFMTGTILMAGLADTPGPGNVGALASISHRNLKHVAKHLGEFQKYDKRISLRDVVALGQRIVANAEGPAGTSGGRSYFDQIVRIGSQLVKVRVVLNEHGTIRSVHIRY